MLLPAEKGLGLGVEEEFLGEGESSGQHWDRYEALFWDKAGDHR